MVRARAGTRMAFDSLWLGMPLLTGGGFDQLHSCLELEPHRHEGFEITYISEGELAWELEDGSALRLHGGCAAITSPRVIHQGEGCVIRPSRLFWLVFNPSAKDARKNTVFSEGDLRLLDKLLKKAGNKVWHASEELALAFEDLRLLLERKNKCEKDEGLLLAFGRTLICRILLAAAHSLAESMNASAKEPPLLAKAKAFLLAKPRFDISIPELASELGLSTARFSVRFKSETGMTPADYLRRVRCDEACRLLKNSKLSITAIAFRTGFASGQHFAGVFKKYFGISPKSYREG